MTQTDLYLVRCLVNEAVSFYSIFNTDQTLEENFTRKEILTLAEVLNQGRALPEDEHFATLTAKIKGNVSFTDSHIELLALKMINLQNEIRTLRTIHQFCVQRPCRKRKCHNLNN